MFNDLQVGTTIKFYSYWTDSYMIGDIESKENGGYKVSIKNNKVSNVFVEEKDVVSVIDKTKRIEPVIERVIVEEDIIEEPIIEEPVIEEKKYKFLGLFADGGISDENIEELPNELTILIPIFDSEGNPISDGEIDNRVNDVSHFVVKNFGGFIVQDMGSSFIDNEGNLIMRKTVQITTYPSDEDFNKHKSQLINQLSLWATEWNQEHLIFEYEDEKFYILGMNDMLRQGGEVWIQDAINQMKKKGTLGAFTKQSKREGLTPIEFAKKVLKNPKGYALKTRRRATFVKNVNPDKF
jgi:hypothetical protein